MGKPAAIIPLYLAIIATSLALYYSDSLGIRDIPLEDLKAKYEKSHSKYIQINETDIHYCDQGQGPVIIALHGTADSLHTWDGWVKAIGDHYRIVRMDIPGFGLTGPPADGHYSRDMFVDFVDKFAAALGINTFIIAGNSLGGAIAWNYAVRHPEKVEKMVLIDPAGYPMEIPWPLKLAGMPVVRNIASLITPRFIYAISLKQVFGDPEKVTPELIDRHFELGLRPGNRKAMTGIMNLLEEHQSDPAFSEGIARISVPTLLLWGEKDTWIPPSHVELWKRDVPDVKVIIYKGVGHIPQVEIPEKSAEDVHKWLSASDRKAVKALSGDSDFAIKVIAGILVLALLLFFVWNKKTTA